MKNTTKNINRVIVILIWAVTLFVIAMSLFGCRTTSKSFRLGQEKRELKADTSAVSSVEYHAVEGSYTVTTDTTDVYVVRRVVVFDTDKAEKDDKTGEWVSPVQSVIDEAIGYGRGRTVVEERERVDSLEIQTSVSGSVRSNEESVEWREEEKKSEGGAGVLSSLCFVLMGFAAGVVVTALIGNRMIFKRNIGI